MRDQDQSMRCLCGNYFAPRNGRCDSGPKGVKHRCRNDDECDDNMICAENNSTSKSTMGTYGKNMMMKESKLTNSINFLNNFDSLRNLLV